LFEHEKSLPSRPCHNLAVAGTLSVGVLRVVLHLPESGSLKSKRQVVSGLLRRVRAEFGVAAAEVGDGDRWQLAELGIACVSNDSRHADEVLNRVLSFIESRAADARVSDVSTELLRL
jgi:uncharacterized protein YlxP (DUF503 family)